MSQRAALANCTGEALKIAARPGPVAIPGEGERDTDAADVGGMVAMANGGGLLGFPCTVPWTWWESGDGKGLGTTQVWPLSHQQELSVALGVEPPCFEPQFSRLERRRGRWLWPGHIVRPSGSWCTEDAW